MKGFLYLNEKRTKHVKADSNIKKIKEIFSRFFGRNHVNVNEFINDNIAFYNFSNESVPIKYNFPPYHFGISGDFLGDESEVFKGFLSSNNKDEYLSNTGGIFAFSAFREQDKRFIAWNNVTRAEPIYWCDTPERIVVGTKALIVHLIAYEINKPQYDISSFTSFINNGFYCDEATPFKGVNVLERNSRIEVKEHKITIKQIDDFDDQMYSVEPSKEYYDEITELFLESFTFLKKQNTTYKIGLTGGKDSRLVVAAMNRLGLDLEATTNGFEDTPDVVIAKQISDSLGIPHHKKLPSYKQNIMNVDLYTRAVNVIKNTEGMIFSYENINGLKDGFDTDKIILGGQGGELFRGGYAKNANITSKESLQNYLLSNFFKYENIITEEASLRYKEFLFNFIDKHQTHLNYHDILNSFYLSYRCGRWSATSRSAYAMGMKNYPPLFEARLVKKAQMLKTQYCRDEYLIYNILMRIAPELVNIPFAEDRWYFEKHHPYSKRDLTKWISRKPIYATTKRSGFNWRTNVLSNHKKQFQEIIFSNESSPLFDIVNKNELKKLFNKEGNFLGKYDILLWSLYTASVLLSDHWFTGEKENSRMRINIPESSKVVKKGVLNDIKHIPADVLTSLHKKVSIFQIDKVTNYIQWVDGQEEDRLYFELFDKPFAVPPSKKFENVSSTKGSQMEFYFELEKYCPNDFSLDIYFIQYDNEKRIFSEKTTFRILDRQKFYSYKVNRHSKAKFFKIAFKIAGAEKDGDFCINQMRMHFYS
ncbi:asparagine synthase-related protein [Bacillus haynesii]|uniref:asparagine synthase-related protein n=1 Tax=Bacillus haynesii TaxID=1925021 RepID=UPI002280F726|nr:asparagine synthase-related protein [Bacillus haynesii]MCY9434010.1 asparagine synthase-related protein [Bacillus haynesii]